MFIEPTFTRNNELVEFRGEKYCMGTSLTFFKRHIYLLSIFFYLYWYPIHEDPDIADIDNENAMHIPTWHFVPW